MGLNYSGRLSNWSIGSGKLTTIGSFTRTNAQRAANAWIRLAQIEQIESIEARAADSSLKSWGKAPRTATWDSCAIQRLV
jgi:hypothetical protein